MREVIGTELPVLLSLKRTRLRMTLGAEVDFGLDRRKPSTDVLAFLFLYREEASPETQMFTNREQAAHQLAQHLEKFKGKIPLVLAIPRGGVPMGKIVAEALEGELDVVLVHKLGAPGNPELAIGAVSETGEVFTNENAAAASVSQDYIDQEAKKQLRVLKERREKYTPDRGAISPEGRTVIVVDDGVATGATMDAALDTIREAGPDALVVAIAVAPQGTVEELREKADEVICLEIPRQFLSVGQAFVEFESVTDEEAIADLQSVRGEA